MALHLILTRTWFGRAVRSVTQDSVGARLCGVRAGAIHAATVAFGSGIAAVAGVLYMLNYPINPYEGFGLTVKAFTIIILGGIGSLPGALARRHLPRRRRGALAASSGPPIGRRA